jgi:hypothetical protein
MFSRARRVLGVAAALAVWAAGPGAHPAPAAAPASRQAPVASLPERLSNQEFWRLSQDLSEPDGYFQSDNLVSNEIWFQVVIPELISRVPRGGVYLGVGPEQNFTYIAAVKPKMVFITDVRRGNLHMHLMYKALFELAKDRAAFLELLFNKPRPAGLNEKSTAADLSNAFWDVHTWSEAEYKANLARVLDHLTKTRELPLSELDRDGIEGVYWHFYWFGPAITYNSSSTGGPGRGGGGGMPTYGDLIMATDASNVMRHFLASEENFQTIRQLHARNLIVPVVGDFAGPKALRGVGRFVRERGGTIDAMYLSNVEQYLQRNGVWGLFCANIASMPLSARSTFIRSVRGGGGGPSLVNQLGSMLEETRICGRP